MFPRVREPFLLLHPPIDGLREVSTGERTWDAAAAQRRERPALPGGPVVPQSCWPLALPGHVGGCPSVRVLANTLKIFVQLIDVNCISFTPNSHLSNY